MIIGTGDIGRIVMQKMRRSPELGYRVVGFIDDAAKVLAVQDVPVLGPTDDLSELVQCLSGLLSLRLKMRSNSRAA